MKKKQYITPEMDIVICRMEAHLLGASTEVSVSTDVYDEGTNGGVRSREDLFWDF